MLVFAVESPFAFCQVMAPKGNFFNQRLTTAAGFDCSLPEDNILPTVGINFSPQLFLITSYTDFSVSAVIDFMVNYRLDSDTKEFSKKYFLQMPAMIHLNIGHGASKDFRSEGGGFLGAGWNILYSADTSENGFAADGGFRFWLIGKSFTLRFIWLLNDSKIFSSGKIISLQMNFGKYLADVKRNNKVSNFMKPYRK